MKFVLTFVIWWRWRSKIRWRYLWEHVGSLYRLGSLSIGQMIVVGRSVGILFMFTIGFALAFLVHQSHLGSGMVWGTVYLILIVDGLSDSTRFGGALRVAQEEAWIVGSIGLTRKLYLVYIWLERYLWNTGSRLLANAAAACGVYLVFPLPLGVAIEFYLCSLLFSGCASFILTMVTFRSATVPATRIAFWRVMLRVGILVLTCALAIVFGRYEIFLVSAVYRLGIMRAEREFFSYFIVYARSHALTWLLPFTLSDMAVQGWQPALTTILIRYFVLAVAAASISFGFATRSRTESTGASSRQQQAVVSRPIERIGRLVNIPYGYCLRMVRSPIVRNYYLSTLWHPIWPIAIVTCFGFLALKDFIPAKTTFDAELVAAIMGSTVLLTSAFARLQTVLAFDSEPNGTQFLWVHEMSTSQIYTMKVKVFQLITSIPVVFLIAAFASICGGSVVTAALLIVTATICAWVFSRHILLSGLLVPHFQSGVWKGSLFDQRFLSRAIRRLSNAPLSAIAILTTLDFTGNSKINEGVLCVILVGFALLAHRLLQHIEASRMKSFHIGETLSTPTQSPLLWKWGRISALVGTFLLVVAALLSAFFVHAIAFVAIGFFVVRLLSGVVILQPRYFMRANPIDNPHSARDEA